MSPLTYYGTIMELARDPPRRFREGRSIPRPTASCSTTRSPLSEILMDFFDQTSSRRTKGYASFDYELSDYRESKLVKIDVLMNGDPVGRALLYHAPG